MTNNRSKIDRRRFLQAGAAAAGIAGFPYIACAQGAKMKIGLMLPYTGTFAQPGIAIENGFRLALQEAGGKLAGREIEFFKVDDESEPSKATDNINRLVTRDKVDLVLGTVHSGVAAAMIRVTKESGVMHIIPNAGFGPATGALCAPNIFRTSFSNWQSGYANWIPTRSSRTCARTRPDQSVLCELGARLHIYLQPQFATGNECEHRGGAARKHQGDRCIFQRVPGGL